MKKLLIAAIFSLFSFAAQAVPGVIYVDTGGSATNSGTTDNNTAVISGSAGAWTTGTAAITLDTNTDISSVPGCAAGTCDGSQAIYLGNATNTATQRIFWISSYTGCTGSGACEVTVSQNVSCSSCTGSAWSVGGRYLSPSGSGVSIYSAALRAGDTVQFNNTPATRTAVYITSATSGTTADGRIRVIGKSGVRPVLEITGGGSVIDGTSGNQWELSNLELKSSVDGAILVLGSNWLVYNNKITGTGGGTSQLGIFSFNDHIIWYNEISGVGASCINPISNTSKTIIAYNYLHGCGSHGILISGNSPYTNIYGNIIAANSGKGIFLSGAPSSVMDASAYITNNTIYGNTGVGLEVTDADYAVMLYNNIIMSTNTANMVTWTAGTAEALGSHGYNVFYSSSSGTLSGITANATESTSNPLLVNPGSANFGLSTGSPALGTGILGALPIGLGASTTGYLNMGAIQSQAGSGVISVRPGIQ